jgi:hypothetical protein
MVTDGEIPKPDEVILSTIAAQHEEKGLEVHGLLVASRVGGGIDFVNGVLRLDCRTSRLSAKSTALALLGLVVDSCARMKH